MLNFRYRIKDKDTSELSVRVATSNNIWNYALRLQRKSYEWYGKYIPLTKLQSYVAKKRKKNKHWMKLNSQSVQEILQRLDESYQRFFKGIQKRPPQFKCWDDDGSFCFKQCGYIIDNDVIHLTDRKIVASFSFLKHRAYPKDKVCTVRIKRYNNRFYVVICCDCNPKSLARDCNGTAGIDFGLKTFITLDNGIEEVCPRFLFKNVKKLRKLSKVVSRRKKGSNRRKKAVAKLANFHAKVKHRRDDWQWKLAHKLCKQYAVIKIEDLCLKGWVALWGRKASDLAVSSFIQKLQYVAAKYKTDIIKVDRFFASSHICPDCGHKLERKLGLDEREWQCPACKIEHKRDVAAARNIKQWDATVRGDSVRPTKEGRISEARIRSPSL